MHKFLRAIGFSNVNTQKDLQGLVADIIQDPSSKTYTDFGNDSIFAEFDKDYAEEIGIAVRGVFEEDKFIYNYYFPYFRGCGITSEEDVSIERHAEKESYAGICDDIKVGVSLIFYMQNIVDYIRVQNANLLPVRGTTLTLSGLSCKGIIMMPIVKNEKEREKIKQVSNNRNHLIAAARKGDEEAMENLTLDDMDMYTSISKKIQKEDVFSLVDTYFMPYGVECDQYSVMGEILEFHLLTNKVTDEKVYVMTISCNELIFDICINQLDLYGEPKVGRRFKGTLWMQGYINFPQ
ncbi:MAG: DUF3881 family protein [Lachnospiraceae bacterium]|nr:DUF3881 family protein [Lachnospiraceae bacterium]